MNEIYFLKWNDFESSVSKSFNLLRNEEYLHDVTLVCDDNSQVSAHKLVLSACSEYFKTLFKNNNHHQSTLICLDGVTSKDLSNILDYMYNGETKIYQESLDRFLKTAQRLKVSGLLQNSNIDCKTKALDIKDNSKTEENSTVTNTEDKRIKHSKINRIIDEYVEVCPDGSYNCTFCGNTNRGRKSKYFEKTSIRCHIETHLEGISFQCHLCDKTFRCVSTLCMSLFFVYPRDLFSGREVVWECTNTEIIKNSNQKYLTLQFISGVEEIETK